MREKIAKKLSDIRRKNEINWYIRFFFFRTAIYLYVFSVLFVFLSISLLCTHFQGKVKYLIKFHFLWTRHFWRRVLFSNVLLSHFVWVDSLYLFDRWDWCGDRDEGGKLNCFSVSSTAKVLHLKKLKTNKCFARKL